MEFGIRDRLHRAARVFPRNRDRAECASVRRRKVGHKVGGCLRNTLPRWKEFSCRNRDVAGPDRSCPPAATGDQLPARPTAHTVSEGHFVQMGSYALCAPSAFEALLYLRRKQIVVVRI